MPYKQASRRESFAPTTEASDVVVIDRPQPQLICVQLTAEGLFLSPHPKVGWQALAAKKPGQAMTMTMAEPSVLFRPWRLTSVATATLEPQALRSVSR